MKRTIILLSCLLSLALPATAFAGKGAKKQKAAQSEGNGKSVTAQQVLKRFDKNADGKIEGAEAEALRKAFNGQRHDALKAFDKNSDGKLDDSEIAAIKPEKQGKKGDKQGKKAEKPAKKTEQAQKKKEK